MTAKSKDVQSGDVFGDWTILSERFTKSTTRHYWFHAKCVCGKEQDVRFDYLYRNKNYFGCGCRRWDHREANKKWLNRRARHIWDKYNLTLEQWELIYDQQLGRCAICLTPLAKVRICVDHDHETNEIRGLLCHTCNVGIGYLKDSPEVLERASHYLKYNRHSVSKTLERKV